VRRRALVTGGAVAAPPPTRPLPLLRHLSALHHGPGAEGGRGRRRDEL